MLEMREIEAFLAVAEELHFGRAAERLRLSTSRVSGLVRTVERRAGGPLFERTSRRVALTPQGAQLFVEFRAAYVGIERALADARRSANLGVGVLRVGFMSTLPEKLVDELVEVFEERYPDCLIVASTLPLSDLFGWLGREWPIDLMVTYLPTDQVPGLPPARIGPVIYYDTRAVLVGTGHPLVERSTVDIEELAVYEVAYPQMPDWFGEACLPATTPGGRPMQLRHLPTRYCEDLVRLATQEGLAHVTVASFLSVYERPGLALVPLTGLPPLAVRAVWPDGPQEAAARAFAGLAARYGAEAGWLTDSA